MHTQHTPMAVHVLGFIAAIALVGAVMAPVVLMAAHVIG